MFIKLINMFAFTNIQEVFDALLERHAAEHIRNMQICFAGGRKVTMRYLYLFLFALLFSSAANGQVGPITGANEVCAGSYTTLSDTTAGGVWTSSDPSIATIGSTGILTGVSAGTTVISYVTGSGS